MVLIPCALVNIKVPVSARSLPSGRHFDWSQLRVPVWLPDRLRLIAAKLVADRQIIFNVTLSEPDRSHTPWQAQHPSRTRHNGHSLLCCAAVYPEAHFNVKTVTPGIENPITKIRGYDRLIFIKGITLLMMSLYWNCSWLFHWHWGNH